MSHNRALLFAKEGHLELLQLGNGMHECTEQAECP